MLVAPLPYGSNAAKRGAEQMASAAKSTQSSEPEAKKPANVLLGFRPASRLAFPSSSASMVYTHPPLKDVHYHPRRGRIRMDEALHRYYVKPMVDGKVAEDTEVEVKISGTGFKDMFFPRFDAVEVINRMFQRARCKSEVYKLTEKSKSVYRDKTWLEIYNIFTGKIDAEGSAAYRGTQWHYLIEMFVYKHARCSNFEAISNERKVEYFLSPDSEHPTTGKDGPYEAFRRPAHIFMHAYDSQIVRQGWKPYALEMQLFDDTLPGYVAGTADAVFYRKPSSSSNAAEYFLVDWKTVSSSVNKDYPGEDRAFYPLHRFTNRKSTHFKVQLNLYAYWLSKYYGLDVKQIKAMCFNLKDCTFETVDVIYDACLVADMYSFYSAHLKRQALLAAWSESKPSNDLYALSPLATYLPSTPRFVV